MQVAGILTVKKHLLLHQLQKMQLYQRQLQTTGIILSLKRDKKKKEKMYDV